MTYNTESIYLDHAATTPVDPRVVDAMLPYFTRRFGNPSSIYRLGQDGLAALGDARRSISRVLGAQSSELVFTSGATESSNLAIKGVVAAARGRGISSPRVAVSAIEHHASLHAAEALTPDGARVDVIPTGSDGRIDPGVLAMHLHDDTALVSFGYANNEIGTIQDVRTLSDIAHARGVPVHLDAVQAPGLLPLDMRALGVDLASLSAHKFYGPKGVGIAYVRKSAAIVYQQDGGGQESGRRGGTENVPLVVGMATALVLAEEARDAYSAHCRALRDALWHALEERVPDISLNGPSLDGPRLPNNLNVSFAGVQGETVLLGLDMAGVAASAGSACTTGNAEPSHVLLAIGLGVGEARSSMRFSVGRGNSIDEIESAVDAIAEVIERTRALSGAVA